MNNEVRFKQINDLFLRNLEKKSISYKRKYFDLLFEEIKTNNIVLIGLRQIGKTTLMEQLGKEYLKDLEKSKIEQLSNQMSLSIEWNTEKYMKQAIQASQPIAPNKMIYLNMKSLKGVDYSTIDLTTYITNENASIVLIDEIQIIENWSDFIQQLADLNKNTRFIFSGSNARALKHESMLGRAKAFYIKPLLFEEFEAIWENNSIWDYLRGGTYPKGSQNEPLVQYEDLVEEQVIDKIAILDSNSVVDLGKFKITIEAVINYVSNEVPVSTFLDDKIVSRPTKTSYLKLMDEARLIRRIANYKSKSDKPLHKIYLEDHCMISYFKSRKGLNNNDKGSLIENVVFNYLDAKYNTQFGMEKIYYFKPKKEIDFIIPDEKLLVEVKFVENLDPEGLSSELNELIKEEIELNSYKKIVITNNTDAEVNNWKFISFENFIKGAYDEL